MMDFAATWVPVLAVTGSPALITFLIYTLAVFGLAALSSRLLQKRAFLSEYFLGSRSLGVWALALTFAATMASGGSFTGFPSLIYTHGWVLALWIASYMIFPICTMGWLGKRINQVGRQTGAITVPDILRDRFRSPGFGLLATSLIVFFMCVNLVGQFKAGSVILQTLLRDNAGYDSAVVVASRLSGVIPLMNSVDPGYLLCLLTFGIAVIMYTTWGGFHAVVWTDVMQGIVMVVGVMIMLPLMIHQVGGLNHATKQLAAMVPPQPAVLSVEQSDDVTLLPMGSWLQTDDAEARVFRTAATVDFATDLTDVELAVAENAGLSTGDRIRTVTAIEIVDPQDLQKLRSGAFPVTFNDGVALRAIADSEAAGLTNASLKAGSYVTAPGPDDDSANGFLPLSLAFSFFFFWAVSGTGQPHSMVRLMAFNNTRTLRMSIVTVAVYYSLIYFPLVVIFCCARLLLPGMEVESDSIMPEVAVTLTNNAGIAWAAGILIAAPFAAVMSTVDSFLLMISSAVVRDIYQRNINPDATERQLKRMSYLCTLLVGVFVIVAAMNPPEYLQYIITYVGSGLAACFLAPMVLSLYWPRATCHGAIASMLFGFLSHLSLYVLGWVFGGDLNGELFSGSFKSPYRPFEFDPVVVGILGSFAAGIIVSLLGAEPPQDLVRTYFYRRRTPIGDAQEDIADPGS